MKLGRLAIIAVATMSIAISAYAQSISDIDLDGFKKLNPQVDVQEHTDPFSSGVAPAENMMVEDLKLYGIAYRSPSESFALISGYLVRPNDSIAGYRVQKIETTKVFLSRVGSAPLMLSLGGGMQ